MPELPEVETVVRDLRPLLVGRRFTGVWAGPLALRKPWMRGWGRRLTGRRVEAIRRRGKWIVAEMEGGDRLVIHLGMTGQLTVAPAEAPTKPHTHLVFDMDECAGQLRFRDVRRFGSVTLFRAEEDVETFFRTAGLGPEPFGLDAVYWRERLAATARCLKAVLLDQRVVAGVGNIYADEALYEARLNPARIASGLDARAPTGCGGPWKPSSTGPSIAAVRASGITSAATAGKARCKWNSAFTAAPASRARAAAPRSSVCGWPGARRTFAPRVKRRRFTTKTQRAQRRV